MEKFKTVFTAAGIDLIKRELYKALDEVSRLDLYKLDDDIEFKSSINGMIQPYIISSIEEKINSMVLILEDSVEQLKAIRNNESVSDFVFDNCEVIKNKIATVQQFYDNKTYAETGHRFKTYEHTSSKGKTITIRLEAATKEQQDKIRSSIQRRVLKLLTSLELLMQETASKTLKGGGETSIRMQFKTKSRGG